jgi:hypothetical protein
MTRSTDLNKELISLMVQDHINRIMDILSNAGYTVVNHLPPAEAA